MTAAGGILASAASLGISGRTLGAGTSVISSCDPNGVALTYTNAYDSASGSYKTSAVTVTGLDNLCNGRRLDITLFGAANVVVGAGSIGALNLPTGTTSAVVSFSPTLTATAITGAAVVIAG